MIGDYVVFGLSVCHSVRHSVLKLYLCRKFCNIEDSNLIVGMHVYLMELHILSDERSMPMSSFKVKCQIYGFKEAQ
jgi:hypothetical protein